MTSGSSGDRAVVPGATGPRRLVPLVLAFVAGTLALGVVLSLRQRAELARGATEFVSAIVGSRVAQAERWLAERRGDLAVASLDPALVAAASGPFDLADRLTPARRRLEVIASSYGYRAAAVLDARDRLVLSWGAPIDLGDPAVKERIARARATGLPAAPRALWSARRPAELGLELLGCLFREEQGRATVVGTLILHIDAAEPLSSILAVKASIARGEINLLVRSGGRVLALYPAQREAGLPWIFEGPRGAPGTPEALLLAGRTDLASAVDEAGAPVVASVHAIAGVPWRAVGALDRAEVYGPATRALWVAIGLGVILVVGTALVGHVLWRRRIEQTVRVVERDQLRAELVSARAAAREAAQAKGQFLANISHEIRTPLNAIAGLGYLLARLPLGAQASDYVEKMQASMRTLLELVNNVLDFSKLEAGRMTIDAVPFRLAEVLGAVTGVLAPAAEAKGLRLACHVAGDVPDALVGDPVRLRQVLSNLVGNGVKFTEKGEVRLEVRRAASAEQLRLEFILTDTGIGIPAEHLPFVFEPFVQADGSSTRRFGGSGLGLAIARQLVTAMGGDLTVESAPGRGSRFRFTLGFFPASVNAPAAAAAPPAPGVRTGHGALLGTRLLVAEDNVINQQVARELLEAAGATVVVAVNGREAVSQVTGAAAPFDAVLMDLQMPEVDGLEATRLIRALPSRGDVPIIAMTAHAFEQERRRCLQAGMNDHIAKPVEPELLIETVARWTVGARARSLSPGLLVGVADTSGDPSDTADFRAGLRRLGGNRELYDRLLARFARDWQDVVPRLRALLDGQVAHDARQVAHTLKGTSATLGLARVSATAGRIEDALRSPSDGPAQKQLGDELGALATAVAATVAAIAARAADAGAAPPVATAPPEAFDLATLVELEELIAHRNLRARETVARLGRSVLPAEAREPFARVVGNVDRLEYQAAAAALAELKALLTRTQGEKRSDR